jgi:cell division septation protein DedD
VSVVVLLLAAAGLLGYLYGLKESEREALQSPQTTAADVSQDTGQHSAAADTPAQVTFYTVLTEPRDDTLPPPQPKKLIPETSREEDGQDQPKGNLALMLQAASYPRRESAMELLETLAEEGYSGTVQRVDLDERGIWFRVRIGPYGSEEEAKKVLATLKEERNLKGYIVR